jgi:hypothetical protein
LLFGVNLDSGPSLERGPKTTDNKSENDPVFIAASNMCRLLPSLEENVTSFVSPGFKITATAAERIGGELAAMSIGGRDCIVADLLFNFAVMCCNDEGIPVPVKIGKVHYQ